MSDLSTTLWIERLIDARRATDEVLGAVDDVTARNQYHANFSPIGWHLGHIAIFEEYWILQRCRGDAPIDPNYEILFSPLTTPKAERALLLPNRDALMAFMTNVRARVIAYLETVDLNADHPLMQHGRILQTVISHEHQHVETMTYVLALAGLSNTSTRSTISSRDWEPTSRGMISIPAGTVRMGSERGEAFAYDNELDPHPVAHEAFSIDRCATTNAEYLAFVSSGGYANAAHWSDRGWQWLQSQKASGPRYWGEQPVEFARAHLVPDHPVERISWFEADAYARWAGGRLPTESEWELAAGWDDATAHMRKFPWGEDEPNRTRATFDRRFAGTEAVDAHPAGASSVGCLGMAGNVWEWTATLFAPYPGFEPWPYAGYSKPYFDGKHFVMRGGSWASRRTALRCTFRNWYTADMCEVFAGVRVVRDSR